MVYRGGGGRLTKKMNDEYKKRGRNILFSVVFLVLGFILAFSYRTLGINQETDSTRSPTFNKEEDYREGLISQQERNKELTDEIAAKQEEIREYERSFSIGEKDHAGLR